MPLSLRRRVSLAAAALTVVFGLSAKAFPQASCSTGLCLQQVSCPNNSTTTVSGVVYTPNGTDPLPNVLVYVPNAALTAFPAQVSCIQGGTPPSGSPIVGTTTAVDGSFTLTNVPVGNNIPVVIQTGRWRRQVLIPTVSACTSTAFSTRMPTTQAEGDIPKIAIATGAEDGLECVLRKVGIADTEFTDVTGTGRVNFWKGAGAPGAQIDAATPSETTLVSTAANLNQYDIVMFPCQGSAYPKTSAQQNNLINFANLGGRVYATHFSYVYLYNDPPFSGTAKWVPNQGDLADGFATIDTTYPGGQTLAQWLQDVGATTTLGQISLSTLRHDQNGVIAPTQSVMTLNGSGNPVMQFTFDTPVGAPAASQCGKVLYNEYHVENPTIALGGKIFPAECQPTAMSPQEKLLEYSLFDLSGNAVIPTLTPVAQDFGTVALGIMSTPQTFTWSNPSPFPLAVASVKASGDFAISSNGCSTVPAAGSCQILVTFTPTVLGARSGTLTVISGQTTLTSSLTGNGVPDIQVSSSTINFGNVDLGASSTMHSVTITNAVPTTIALQPISLTGDYTETTNCGATLGPTANCSVNLTFTPAATGPRPGLLTVSSTNPSYGSASTTLTGNGVDFSLLLAPTSGSVIAGYPTGTAATITPLGGFTGTIALSCTTNAAASVCTPATASLTPSAAVTVPIGITTTAKFVVVGYGGLGGGVLLSLGGFALGAVVWLQRRRGATLPRVCLMLALLAGIGAWTTGCSGRLPAENTPFTAPGNYTYTVTATDGFLTRSATYSLTVAAK